MGETVAETPRRRRGPAAPRDLPRMAYRPIEAANVLGISMSSVYSMIADGTIRAKKLGAITVIRVEELQRVLQDDPNPDVTKSAQASIR